MKVLQCIPTAAEYAMSYWEHLTNSEREDHHAYIGICELNLDDLTPDTSDGIYYQEYIN